MQLFFDFPVEPSYTFDNFVVCTGNKTAYQFAKRLVDGANHDNLLYMYGPSGSGKTHLLSALGAAIPRQDDVNSPAMLSFRDQVFVASVQEPGGPSLADRFGGMPALLIDDLHLMPDNQDVRVQLWQVFNDFYTSGRMVAITGGMPPKELPHLDDHLISRLLWGLVAKVDVSDDDSRRMIIKKVSDDRQVLLPDDVIEYLLVHVRRDIPSLLAALEEIFKHSFSTAKKVSLRLAREALGQR